MRNRSPRLSLLRLFFVVGGLFLRMRKKVSFGRIYILLNETALRRNPPGRRVIFI